MRIGLTAAKSKCAAKGRTQQERVRPDLEEEGEEYLLLALSHIWFGRGLVSPSGRSRHWSTRRPATNFKLTCGQRTYLDQGDKSIT